MRFWSSLFAIIVLASCGKAPSRQLPMTFWVWNRDDPLSAPEIQSLKNASVQRLCWHVGELELGTASELRWNERHPLPKDTDGLHFVPTIRVNASAVEPLKWIGSLAMQVNAWPEVQIDFDCRTTRLGEYAAALQRLRSEVPGIRLSITALAHWPQAAQWHELMQAVDEVFPMFYDLALDPKLKSGEKPPPLLDPAVVARWARPWQDCPVPWQLGLPNVTRVTLFDKAGSRHLRTWDSSTLATWGKVIARDGSSLLLWDQAAVRRPDPASLLQALDIGAQAGAAGVCWFSLPQPGRAANGWSVAHLQHLDPRGGKPAFSVSTAPVEGGVRLLLRNTGPNDLIDDLGRNSLCLRVPPGSVREVLPGQFSGTVFLLQSKPVTDPRDADEIHMTFSRLDSASSLESGLARIRLSAGGAPLWWRVQSDMVSSTWDTFVLPQ